MSKRFILPALALLSLSAGTAQAKDAGPTLRDRQQAACYDDVQRLCASAVPDVEKVTACMKDKKAVVSPKCAAMWDAK